MSRENIQVPDSQCLSSKEGSGNPLGSSSSLFARSSHSSEEKKSGVLVPHKPDKPASLRFSRHHSEVVQSPDSAVLSFESHVLSIVSTHSMHEQMESCLIPTRPMGSNPHVRPQFALPSDGASADDDKSPSLVSIADFKSPVTSPVRSHKKQSEVLGSISLVASGFFRQSPSSSSTTTTTVTSPGLLNLNSESSNQFLVPPLFEALFPLSSPLNSPLKANEDSLASVLSPHSLSPK